MRADDLTIAEPCSASWDEMDGGDERRFCAHCQKHVHHLSAMTPQAARSLLGAPRGAADSLCVRYTADPGGAVRFGARPLAASGPRRQVTGATELVARAAALASMLSALVHGAQALAEGAVLMGEPPAVEPARMGDYVGQVPVEPGSEPCDGSAEVPAQEEADVETLDPRPDLEVQGGLPADPMMWDQSEPKRSKLSFVLDAQEDAAAAHLAAWGIVLEDTELVASAEGSGDCAEGSGTVGGLPEPPELEQFEDDIYSPETLMGRLPVYR